MFCGVRDRDGRLRVGLTDNLHLEFLEVVIVGFDLGLDFEVHVRVAVVATNGIGYCCDDPILGSVGDWVIICAEEVCREIEEVILIEVANYI